MNFSLVRTADSVPYATFTQKINSVEDLLILFSKNGFSIPVAQAKRIFENKVSAVYWENNAATELDHATLEAS